MNIIKLKHRRYWTKELSHNEALKYTTRTDFNKGSRGAYQHANRNNYLNDICSHMEIQGNNFLRFIYVFEFEDKSAYVGLTQGVKGRENKHLNDERSKVYKHIKKTSAKYILKTINNVPSLKGDAQELEHKIKLEYIDNGWEILNKGATGRGVGSLGGNYSIWSRESCENEALKYKTRTEFIKQASGSYQYAKKHGFLDDICSHMVSKIKPDGYWNNKETCHLEALKYKTRGEFSKKSVGAYNAANKNKWLDDICSHMIGIKKPNSYWTEEKTHKEALKYKTRTEFKIQSAGAYNAAVKNKWLNYICCHMIEKRKNDGYWVYETCKNEALKYKTRTEFCKNVSGAYTVSRINNWLDEFFPEN